MGFFNPDIASDRHRLLDIQRKVTKIMSATDDLIDGVDAVKTAVGDAANALKDLAAKLTSASSVNPGDVESAAAQLKQIAAGLETVVSGVGEPVTAEDPAPPAEPAPVVIEPAPPAETPPA